ncbi:hypothetical protein BDR05DRAFT_1006432 [Suillus weaverae]|nr:hypothetical protein BDR05DRAFT_1006432 [Suillus weaverae]
MAHWHWTPALPAGKHVPRYSSLLNVRPDVEWNSAIDTAVFASFQLRLHPPLASFQLRLSSPTHIVSALSSSPTRIVSALSSSPTHIVSALSSSLQPILLTMAALHGPILPVHPSPFRSL